MPSQRHPSCSGLAHSSGKLPLVSGEICHHFSLAGKQAWSQNSIAMKPMESLGRYWVSRMSSKCWALGLGEALHLSVNTGGPFNCVCAPVGVCFFFFLWNIEVMSYLLNWNMASGKRKRESCEMVFCLNNLLQLSKDPPHSHNTEPREGKKKSLHQLHCLFYNRTGN